MGKEKLTEKDWEIIKGIKRGHPKTDIFVMTSLFIVIILFLLKSLSFCNCTSQSMDVCLREIMLCRSKIFIYLGVVCLGYIFYINKITLNRKRLEILDKLLE